PLAPPESITPPAIYGTARQQHLLLERHGSWRNEPTSFAYQWLQCDALGNGCLPVTGASGPLYVPVAGDVGHTLRVQETASNAAGAGAPAVSAPTAPVLPPPPRNTSPPAISGTAQQGQALDASPGEWIGSPTSFTYAWQRCDSAGANCTAIAGAGAASYRLTEADLAKTVRVSVTAANQGGRSAPAASAQSAVVAGAAGVSRLEYVLQDGITSVYDMDHEYRLIKTISLPQTNAEVRGVTVAPASH